MKRITAFLVALCLFCSTVYGLHIYSEKAINMNNNDFSTWSNKAKFSSTDSIKANLNDNSIVVFGSSEFQHGQKTIYHPKKMFKDFKFNPMLIGAGYYQCLQHAITLTAIGDEIKTKKVVLLLSPSWFRKEGVKDTAFSSRFSENAYLEMLENNEISSETKDYIIQRTRKLLNVDDATLKRVEIYNKVELGQESSFMDRFNYYVYKNVNTEKSRQSVIFQWYTTMFGEKQNNVRADRDINWKEYEAKAQIQGERKSDNPFYMTPLGFAKVQCKYNGKKIERKFVNCYSESPEYDDLRCFLDICKEMNVEPLLVSLPVNGYWYDYTGFPKETRSKYYENIRNIAAEYNVELADLSNEEFNKYFFEDSVHLAGKGWVKVNEILYDFYKEDKE
ncbi:MAG: D-alanyl-lipoteichoic acid biosynthesis protein DltD [Aminipila sp.]